MPRNYSGELTAWQLDMYSLGDWPNCLWKHVEKYETELNPTRKAASLTLQDPLRSISAGAGAQESLREWEEVLSLEGCGQAIGRPASFPA